MKKYTTVKELIDKLKEMPQDAPIFAYNNCEECDVQLDAIASVVPREKYIPENVEERYVGQSPYYCKGDAEANWFLEMNPDIKEVVVINYDPAEVG